jgi:hypothetical protein
MIIGLEVVQGTKGHQKYTETESHYLKKKQKYTRKQEPPTLQPRENLRPLEEKE